MRQITLEELLEAGCHFGHQVTRGNPKARDFIYEARDNIHIIDLAKTKEGLDEASVFIKDLAQKNGTLLIVGTKRQAQGIVKQQIERAKNLLKDKKINLDERLFYITEKWIGGVLTNFSEVSKNLKKLKDLEEKLKSEEQKQGFTKKEIGLWEKERQRLEELYGGIVNMQKMPDALFIIDSHLEELAVLEAQRMNVTTVAIVDTNADPTVIDYPIPANDDAVGSIELITSYIIEAWIEGVRLAVSQPVTSDVKRSTIRAATTKPKPKTTKEEEDGKSKRSKKIKK